MSAARIVVLVSGGGSNLQALLDASASGRLGAVIVAVFSDRREAFGLERARRAGVEARYRPYGPVRDAGGTREDYDAALAAEIEALAPDLVVCAGWMRVLSRAFLDRFGSRVVNLHPALPGEYPGTHAIERAWRDAAAGLRDHTGVMVHVVIPEIDAGPVLATARVPILPGEALDALEARVHATEHALLVGAVADYLISLRGADAPRGA
jgi:phosphoribosylglycinamide formyltransferase-1